MSIPAVGEIARALADPHHPDARALARLAGLLLLGALAFALMMGLAIAEAPELRLNQMVLNLALSLHTPGANHLMAAASRLGDLAVILPLGIAVLIWLLARGHTAAGGLLDRRPRLRPPGPAPPQVAAPGTAPGYWPRRAVQPWAFPSSHVLRATVTYGFLAVCLAGAGAMPQAWRWLPYALAAMLATAVAISRLYLGAHWLTDVIGGLALGLAWVAALGLSFRRHTRPAPSWHGLAALSSAALVLAYGVASLSFHAAHLALYQPKRESITLSAGPMAGPGRGATLPQWREDIQGMNGQPLNLQYAGDPRVLTQALAAQGWRAADTLSFENALRLLSPSLSLMELPLIPHVHDGHHEDLGLIKQEGEDGRRVLRLWATPYLIDGRQPLWIGNITTQHKRLILNLLAIPATGRTRSRP